MSRSPATTCAFVTTSPSPATQPEPSTPRPHAVPSTFTTLPAASSTSGSLSIPRAGGATFASGPSIFGKGSSRRRELSSGPEGGRIVLSRCRIVERWTSIADPVRAVLHRQRADDPDHAEPGADDQHRAEQAVDRPESGRRREHAPDAAAERLEQARERGAYDESAGEAERRCVRRLLAFGEDEWADARPDVCPDGGPASASRPEMNPWAQPNSARSRTRPRMIQSSPVTASSVQSHPSGNESHRHRHCRPYPHRPSLQAQRARPETRRRHACRRRPKPAWRRIAPIIAVAMLGVRRRDLVGAGGEQAERTVARALRERVGAATRGDARAADATGAGAHPAQALRRRLPEGRRDRHGSPASSPAAPASRARRHGRVPVQVRTRLFGTLASPLDAPAALMTGGKTAASTGGPSSSTPACARASGSRARRGCRRARPSQARDGTPLAKGERAPDGRPVAADVVGTVGPAPPERAAELTARGVPPGRAGRAHRARAAVRRASSPAGPAASCAPAARVLAERQPRPGDAVRTTIDPRVQSAAVTALAGRYGGIAAMRPHDGEVLALAGIAYSAPQPPGSVFKIITLAGALEAGVAEPVEPFPVQQAATLEGVELENANGEACGGTLRDLVRALLQLRLRAASGASSAPSASSHTAERFGFNEQPALARRAPVDDPARRARSATTSRSARRRSGRARCSPRRSRWRASPPRSREHGVRPRPTLARARAPEHRARDAASRRAQGRRATCARS